MVNRREGRTMERVKNMTEGHPAFLMISFAFPLIIANFGQQLYMIVDAMIVGKGVGVEALAAVGATDWSYWLVLWTVQALTQGKIDAVVIDGEPAKEFVKEAEGLKILDEAFTEEEYAIAISKDNEELLEKVNGALKTLKDSGKLDEIVAKYIKADAE